MFEQKHFLSMLIKTSHFSTMIYFSIRSIQPRSQSNEARYIQASPTATSGWRCCCSPVILIRGKLGLQRFHLCSHRTKVFAGLLTLLWYWKRNSATFGAWQRTELCQQRVFSADSAVYAPLLSKIVYWHLNQRNTQCRTTDHRQRRNTPEF